MQLSRALLFIFLISTSIWGGPVERRGFDFTALDSLAIQDRGRLKPFDTFARESVLFVTGRSKWKGMSASEVVFSWLVALDREWTDEEFVRVDYKPLKEKLGLDVKKNYFTLESLKSAKGLEEIVREAAKKEGRKERLSPVEKKAVEVENRINLLDAFLSGTPFAILPNPKGLHEDWFALPALTRPGALPYQGPALDKLSQALKGAIDAFLKNDAGNWNKDSYTVNRVLASELGQPYPTVSELNREIHYNRLHPFRWAWVLYTLAFIFLMTAMISAGSLVRKVGMVLLAAGFAMHIYGFILRCLIAGRPPVTNMYESVIWVSWGAVLFALLIYRSYRSLVIPTSAVVFSAVCLVLADSLPLALDPAIHPLVPVLRSNYWLTIHVLTITLSYAAFAVSVCVGNANLALYLFRPRSTESIQQNITYMYRAMQIGVILLAAGTILGGIWADYSWGRFWGWDPKEVWALVALLFYIAVLHGRFTGWLRGFGFVATTVISFLGVVMAWYGVNFVLGVGLHSYGFGSGGFTYVAIYVIAQCAFIGLAYASYRKAGKPDNKVVLPRAGS